MRLNIASKLFIGFICVILLNAFFFVIVSQIDNVNRIVNILRSQNEVKNNLIRLKTLHRIQGPSILSFQSIGRQESVDDFNGIHVTIRRLIDSIQQQVDSIKSLDSCLVSKGRSTRNIEAVARTTGLLHRIGSNDAHYSGLFGQFVELRQLVETPQSEKSKSMLMDSINQTETLITTELDSAENFLSEQTNIRIKDIGYDVTNIKKVTIFILTGITLFSILFAFIFSGTITNSLRRLKDSASQIGKADFNINPQGYPNDEIGDLATAFFDMAVDLRNKQEEVIKSKRLAAIGEIVASVNHEINNPLMIISGNAQFLEMSMETFPDDMKERVRTILEETDRISQVTKKLREIKNLVTEDYTRSGEQMINLEKSTL
jgi:phosphoglycerate-specific signal transduction histidine kinase